MSSIEFTLSAELRADAGKGASRRLRHEGKVPAILYGGAEAPVAISLAHKEVIRKLQDEAFYSHILTVDVAGKPVKAVLKDLHRHPYRPIVMHMDLQRVTDDMVIHMNVPVHFINESTAPGVKAGGKVSHVVTSVEVTCQAKDLPEFIEVDLGAVEQGQSVHLSDIRLPAGVELVQLLLGADHDQPVAVIPAPRGGSEE